MSTPPVLHASLDVPLPGEVVVGAGTAVFVAGTCYCPQRPIEALELVVDGEPQPLDAFGMPRLDFFAELHPGLDPRATEGLAEDAGSAADPALRGYASGFWGLARIASRREVHAIGLRAVLAGGAVVHAQLARAAERHADAPAAPGGGPAWPVGAVGPRIAIAMATYDPPAELFRAQIDSIRAQTHANWVCVISDDHSSPQVLARLEAEVAGDGRFHVVGSSRRRGFFGNFERALGLAPADADLVALADQDDVWYPEKLRVLAGAIGGAQLVYSDSRLVARSGEVLADSYWGRRRNNHSDLLSLLVANSVSGAASLFRRDLLDDALPFPPGQFAHFHDHWLALTALARGEIAYVDAPLYDYVQHGAATLGHTAANQMTSLGERLRHQRALGERVRMWRLHYFVDIWRLRQCAGILLMRCGGRMERSKRRVLERFLLADRSPRALTTLALRGARELVGRPETLGAEWMLVHALLWRRVLAATARERPQRRLRLDAVPPPDLAIAPAPAATGASGPAAELAAKIAPLALAVSDRAPRRVNILIPTIDLRHFFGGYIAKFNLAGRLAERGLRVRLVTTDPVGPLPPAWQRTVEAYSGLAGLFEHVEVAFGRGPSPLEVSDGDAFVATTWWTAHIAAAAVAELGAPGFLYLIQEYEPFTFPMGSYAALAAASYDAPHAAVFSSELLREYFRRHGIGVYAAGGPAGDAASLAFENAITSVPPPIVERLAARRARRLLFYARPEPHAARNMFELGMLALARAVEDGVFASGWELHGIGTVEGGRRLPVAAGVALELHPRYDQARYAEVLGDHDVGLALMYTPHPSLVPIEMASAGMLAVTNCFENKTADALTAISPNLIATAPSVAAVAGGLREAVARVEDHAGRVAGSRVAWSRSWETSFGAAEVDAIVDLLAGCAGPG